jgi:hypothetical protein
VVEEAIVDVVLFAFAWLAGGGGDDAPELRNFGEHTVAERGFTTACGAGYDDE